MPKYDKFLKSFVVDMKQICFRLNFKHFLVHNNYSTCHTYMSTLSPCLTSHAKTIWVPLKNRKKWGPWAHAQCVHYKCWSAVSRKDTAAVSRFKTS